MNGNRNNQNRLIQGLLKLGKKHKMLVYPMLALVAVVSAFSYGYRWATGSGKRIVAAVLVGVLLISQSYFMTSSANESALIIEEEEEEELLIDSDAEEEETTNTLVDSADADAYASDDDDEGQQTASVVSNESDDEEEGMVTGATDSFGAEGNNEEDGASEGTIGQSTYNSDGKGTITQMTFTDSDQSTYADSSTNPILYPAGTSQNTVMASLPSTLKCTIQPTSGDSYTQNLDVTWSVNTSQTTGGFTNTNGSTIVFSPTVTKASDYESVTYKDGESNDIIIKVQFRTKYTVNLSYTGTLNTGSSTLLYDSSTGAYYGYCGSTYTLPSVTRTKADTSLVENTTFTFTGWSYSSALYGGTSENSSFIISDAAVTEVTLTANYKEAEVTYVDEKNTTTYAYPDKGSTYTVATAPSTVYGYKFNGWTNGDNTYAADSNTISNIDDMTLTASWSALTYTITYNSNYDTDKGTGTMSDETHTYDASGDTLTVCGYTRYGYTFAGWETTGNDEKAYDDGAKITTDMLSSVFGESNENENPTLTLYAVWKEVAITYDDYTTSKNLASTYGTAISETYGITNGETSSKNFSATVKSVTKDNNNVTMSEYINEFSVKVSSSNLVVTGTPIIVWTGSLTVTVTVSDTVAGTSADLTLVITSAKKELTISSVTMDAKTYDGTTTVTDACKDSLTITLSGIYSSDDVSVNTTNLSLSYDSKNAGTRDLIISSIELNNEKKDYYTIGSSYTAKDSVTINKQALNITLTGTITKYSGEEAADPSNQNFEIAYADDVTDAVKALVTNDGGLSSANVMTITYDVPDVNSEDTYDITVTVLSDNYDVSCTASCKLVVTQDAAILKTADMEGNYSITGDYNKDTGWYTSIVSILPEILHGTDYYDQILRVGTQEWSSSPITIDDESSINQTAISVMMKNSRTGAYTAESEKMTFYVDTYAPVYGGATFSAASETSVLENIGLFFTYGNFFKETVKATLTFTDATSGLSKIYYDVDASGEWTEKSLSGNEDSITITIPLSTNNEITFYTVDVAGNASDETTLTGNLDGSLWVIENSEPEITGYYVANAAGDKISNLSSGGWYNQYVSVVAQVIESKSGIHYADWYINGTLFEEEITSLVRSDETSAATLTYDFSASGVYDVSLKVVDNATNATDVTELTTIQIDLEGPEIDVDESAISDDWAQSVDIPFTVTDDVSGVYRVSVVTPDESSYVISPNTDGSYTLTATTEGTYTIYARDEAYNETTKEITVGNISDEVPANASITWSPENPNGSNNWYTITTAVKIVPVTVTGSVPTTTYYKLYSDGNEPESATSISDTVTLTIPEDGTWTLKVWTETAAGVTCDSIYERTVYVDETAPEAMITSVLAETSYQTVTFTVTDVTSGVESDQIKVVNGSATVSSTVTALSDGSGYQGTFTVSSPGDYVISVTDNAGNTSTAASYTPMTLKVNAIKNITESTATISSVTYRGTYAVSSVKYEYKKASSSSYKEITPYTVKDESGNVTASYSFQNLKAQTKYNYRITTVSAIGEALTYTGSFKTAGADGISITGKAVDADDSTATIMVSLLEGNTVLDTTEITSGNSFVFTKVADGNYNIQATNGLTTKTISVNIYNGKVIDPSGDILIVLRNGMSTSVVVSGTKTPNISVSGLEDIFTYDTVNFTDADKTFISEGGTVEFRLNAAYKSSSSVTKTALSAIYNLMSDDEKVNMLLDLTLTKIRTYASGAVESTTQVTELGGGVTLKIVIPMPDKVVSAKEKSVIRVHGSKAKLLSDLDSSANSYTLKTNQFSVYALTYKTSGTSDAATTSDDDASDGDSSTKSIKDYDASPKTGDDEDVFAASLLLIISLFGCYVCRRKIK